MTDYKLEENMNIINYVHKHMMVITNFSFCFGFSFAIGCIDECCHQLILEVGRKNVIRLALLAGLITTGQRERQHCFSSHVPAFIVTQLEREYVSR